MKTNKYIYRFKYDIEISSPLAFIFLLILSFSVAWYCLAVADEVVRNAKESSSFNIQVRINKNK